MGISVCAKVENSFKARVYVCECEYQDREMYVDYNGIAKDIICDVYEFFLRQDREFVRVD